MVRHDMFRHVDYMSWTRGLTNDKPGIYFLHRGILLESCLPNNMCTWRYLLCLVRSNLAVVSFWSRFYNSFWRFKDRTQIRLFSRNFALRLGSIQNQMSVGKKGHGPVYWWSMLGGPLYVQNLTESWPKGQHFILKNIASLSFFDNIFA
jgi:hypothetical protein